MISRFVATRFVPNWFVSKMISTAVLTAMCAHAQLSPRQLFYDDGKADVSAKKTPEAKPVVQSPIANKKIVAPKPVVRKKVATEEPEVARRIPTVENAGVLLTNVQFNPMVLRYSILKMVEGDQWEEVAEDSRFQTGERIQIQAEGNQDGYLYILAQGTSGTWKPLFPNKELGSDNRVTPHTPVRYPKEDNVAFTFSGKPGTEKVFIAYSRNPVEDMDKLIYEMNRNGNPPDRTMLAGNALPIQNSEVERLKIRSRDLIIEIVKEKDQASSKPKVAAVERKKETAVYVATKDSSSGARVIAEIRLKHE